MKNRSFFFIFIFCFSVLTCTQNKIENINSASKIKPILQYSSQGFFSIENNTYKIYEPVYKDILSDGKYQILGYISKNIKIDFIIKNQMLLTDKTIYIDENYSPIKKWDSEEVKLLCDEYFSRISRDKNLKSIYYNDAVFEIQYNNETPLSQNTKLNYKHKEETYTIFSEPCFYVFSKQYNSYLLIALHSQGGSGHTVYLRIYNLEEIISAIK